MEVARFDAARGEVISLGADGDSILVVTRSGWALETGDGATPWHGDAERGSPESIGSPAVATLSGGEVFIADGMSRQLQLWTSAGEVVDRRPLPVSFDMAVQFYGFDPAPDRGAWLTSYGANTDGTAAWMIERVDASGGVHLVDSIPADSPHAIFDRPHLLEGPDGGWIRVGALELRVVRLGAGSNAEGVLELPVWRVPQRERTEYERLFAQMPPATALHARLPESWPPIREIERMRDGRVLVEVTAGAEATHLLLLDAELRPVARLSEEAMTRPVFLSDGRAFRVTEELNHVVIHELHF